MYVGKLYIRIQYAPVLFYVVLWFVCCCCCCCCCNNCFMVSINDPSWGISTNGIVGIVVGVVVAIGVVVVVGTAMVLFELTLVADDSFDSSGVTFRNSS